MIDANAVRRVVRLAGIGSGDSVVEVGAGLGTLTLGLSAAAGQVFALEIDRRLLPALEETVSGLPNVRVIQADAMGFDFAALTRGRPHRLVANLPYNIATPLVAEVLEGAPDIFELSMVVQREAGERFVASPGSRIYGAISVMVAYYCTGRIVGKVPATVFWPQPNVESVVVRLTRRAPEVEIDPTQLKIVVRAAFSQRRKTIRNTLAGGLGISIPEVEQVLTAAGIEPGSRAESLSLKDFAALAAEIVRKNLLKSAEDGL